MAGRGRGLKRIQRQWERLGADDPLYAVLSDEGKKGAWSLEEFMASGERTIAWMLGHLSDLGVAVHRGAALDFGCGVGRLTVALADHFDRAEGVDVSAQMVEEATRLHGDRASFHLNPRSDLALFEDGRFDLVLSYLVLQHMPGPLALGYVQEFVRVLAPGGVAVFQAPEALLRSGRLDDPRMLGSTLRNLGSRAKGALLRRPPMEMHMLPRRRVTAAAAAAGGVVVEATEDGTGGDFCRSVRYVVQRPPRG